MTRDVRERLLTYSRLPASFLEVERLALNWDQVQQWNPPENPAKETDARYSSYASEFGESSWELDAVEPATLANLVENAVREYRDEDLWQDAVAEENGMITKLNTLAETFSD